MLQAVAPAHVATMQEGQKATELGNRPVQLRGLSMGLVQPSKPGLTVVPQRICSLVNAL